MIKKDTISCKLCGDVIFKGAHVAKILEVSPTAYDEYEYCFRCGALIESGKIKLKGISD